MAKSKPGPEPVHPWSDLIAEFEIEDVRIVATLEHDGGALVELVDKLECREGRTYHVHPGSRVGDDYTYTLEYGFAFTACGATNPLASQSSEARIVITGHHTNGKRMEVRGNGWIGYDNEGTVEGCFDSPPAILTEETEFPPSDEPEWTDEQIAAHLRTDYPMPKQFLDALVRLPPNRDGGE